MIDPNQTETNEKRGKRRFFAGGTSVVLMLALPIVAFLVANSPRASFPSGERIHIPDGASLTQIAAILDEYKVIRSAFLFRGIVSFEGAHANIHAGTHMFPEPLSTMGVARAMIDRSSIAPPIKLTIPEGSTLKDFDSIAARMLTLVEEGDIEKRAEGEEGLLFPDTYLFDEDVSADEVFLRMRENYESKISPLRERIAQSGYSEAEIVILASLLEREANSELSMRMVSGILHERLRINMPLQVDATFAYLLGKESSELTASDLEMDSPFNTYVHYGLPPSPIGSPGLMALEAALNPIESEYLYYLTDTEGNFHYAETFDEHKRNKAEYLR